MRRIASAAATLGVAAALGVGFVAGALTTPLGASTPAATASKFRLDNPCTYASKRAVKRAFKKPVTAATPAGSTVCYLDLGPDPDVAPNGRLAFTQEFPGNGAFATAREQFDDKRAIENLSEFETADVNGIGLAAYSNRDTGALTVMASKKLVFTLSWIPAGRTGVTRDEANALERVARNVIGRSRG